MVDTPNELQHSAFHDVDRRFAMSYTKEEKLNIGRQIYDGELNRYQAAEQYGISEDTARSYMRQYRDVNHLPPKRHKKASFSGAAPVVTPQTAPTGLEELQAMTKEELIRELVKARITEARLKKGYIVKGDGPDREYVLFGSKNTK